MTALNPKGINLFVAFLLQFIDARAPVAPQLWVLAATLVLRAQSLCGAVRFELAPALHEAFAARASFGIPARRR